MLTTEQLEEEIDEDGSAPSYQGVATDYATCEAVGNREFEGGDGYVSIIADYQDRYIETRIQFDTLKSIGWSRDATGSINANLLAELERLEWQDSFDMQICPACDGIHSDDEGSGHKPDCTLAAALSKAKGVPAPSL